MSKSRISSVVSPSEFRKRLLRWFDRQKRDLPWRGERDPYRILVSEIMLQQTRVAVVKGRYREFLRRFPTASSLARAREQTVLAAWSGLGYYRRARSLHAAAKEIMRVRKFPRSSQELMQLPGVGRYTANAVASIALGEAVAVVDGNVKRVLLRLCGRPLKEDQYWTIAGDLLDPSRPGDSNQALMEMGALICLPRDPLCSRCPLVELCATRGAGTKKPRPRRRKGILNYALVRRNGAVLLQQRSFGDSLMPGMWELPAHGRFSPQKEPMLRLRHSITTTDYSVFVFAAKKKASQSERWVPIQSAKQLPLTGLTRKILDLAGRALLRH